MSFAVKAHRKLSDLILVSLCDWARSDPPIVLAAKDLRDERVACKYSRPSRDRLFLKTEDLAVLSSEAIHHLGLLLFHVDDLFPLCIFVGWCPGDEG